MLFELIKKGVKNIKNVETVICPASLYLPLFKGLPLGGQNCSWEEKGTYTGEVSALMLKDIGAEYVIIGHSERRKHFQETDEDVNRKVKKAIHAGLRVILCIGESFEEREKNETKDILKSQLAAALNGVTEVKNLNVAYEPIWAISTGDPYTTKELPTVEKIEKIFLYIQGLLVSMYGQEGTKDIRIIYGGSANSQNAGGYLKEAKMQGLLVGGASLNADEFIKIVKAAI